MGHVRGSVGCNVAVPGRGVVVVVDLGVDAVGVWAVGVESEGVAVVVWEDSVWIRTCGALDHAYSSGNMTT